MTATKPRKKKAHARPPRPRWVRGFLKMQKMAPGISAGAGKDGKEGERARKWDRPGRDGREGWRGRTRRDRCVEASQMEA